MFSSCVLVFIFANKRLQQGYPSTRVARKRWRKLQNSRFERRAYAASDRPLPDAETAL